MITINIILLLKIIGLSYIISQFLPFTWLIDKLPSGFIQSLLHLLTGCLKCVSFWITLIWTYNIYLAIFIYFMASALSRDDKFIYYSNLIKKEIYNKYSELKLKYYIKRCEKLLKKINDANGTIQ